MKEELERKMMMVVQTYTGAAQDISGIHGKRKGLERLEKGHKLAGVKKLTSGMS